MAHQFSEEEFDNAREVMNKYAGVGTAIAQRLIVACRESDGETAGEIAGHLTEEADPYLLMMVLGQLTIRAVNAEKRANEAHGPMIDPDDLGITPAARPTWQIAVDDQLGAAANDNDYKAFAKICVDAQIRSLLSDMDDNNMRELPFEDVLQGVLTLNHATVSVLAAEMLTRLAQQIKDSR